MGLKTLNQIKNELQESIVINSYDANVFYFKDMINIESKIREALLKKSNTIEIEDLPKKHQEMLKKSGYIFITTNNITIIDLLNSTNTIRYCKTCGKEMFNTNYGYKYCSRECNPRYRKKETQEERTIRLRKQYRSEHLKKKYKITKEEYNYLLTTQQEKCAICGKGINNSIRRLAVDHDHKSGAIRGLLCASCNIGLGCFKDKIKNLQEAIKYLKNSRKSNE